MSLMPDPTPPPIAPKIAPGTAPTPPAAAPTIAPVPAPINASLPYCPALNCPMIASLVFLLLYEALRWNN